MSFDPTEFEDEEDFEDEEGDASLDRLEAIGRFHNMKTVAYKTVDMFAGITKRRLWLKNAQGRDASTDGHEIKVPFADPEFYRLVEEQLGHILFRSDAKAKGIFVKEYSGKVKQVAEKMGVELDAEFLGTALDHIITVLEKRRVLSLWEVLYPGSSELITRLRQHDVVPLLGAAHQNLLTYITCLAIHPEATPDGELDEFKPFIEEALKKVHKRGFSATLSTSKWLVMQLVNQLIRDMKDLPPPQPPQPCQQPMQQQAGAAGSSAQQAPGDGDDGGEGDGAGDQDGAEDQEGDSDAQAGSGSASADGDDQDPSEDEEDAGGGSGDGEGETDSSPEEDEGDGGEEERDEPWNPPGPDASGQERTQALKDLLDKLGKPPPAVKDTVQESKFQKGRRSPKAQATANQALASNVNDGDKFEQSLEDSEQEMKDLLQQAQQAMRQQMHHDDWLQKDAMARIQFVDHEQHGVTPKLEHEDAETVQRLRALFYRVMGKRRAVLEDAGTEIDVLAYIERKMTGVPSPVFRAEGMGRGFRAHLLLDRSSSMIGDKTEQCARACRVIQRALRFPFVELNVWGFSSFENGGITLTRYNTKREVIITDRDRGSGGMTPLHVAARLGVRELQGGTEAKQLFVVTDGFPTHTRRDGREFSTQQLMLFTREEVRKARSMGINVTGIMLGQRDRGWGFGGGEALDGVYYDMKERDLAYMFGARRNWKRMRPDRIGRDLVELVATSFIDFLRSR